MNKKDYPNGYRDKVEYWSTKLVQATSAHSTEEVLEIMKSLEYFTKKHAEWLKPKKKIIEQLDLGNGNIIYGVSETPEQAIKRKLFEL